MRNWQVKGRSGHRRVISEMDRHEVELMESLVASLMDLFRERADSEPSDELADITGIRSGHTAPPEDLTLARLLPDFHRPDQDEVTGPDAATGNINGALRSLHEPEILDAKVAAATVLLDTLPSPWGRVSLDEEQANCWLTAVNDVRLALGAMIGITEDTPLEYPDDHPMAAHLSVYHWLTALQDLLVSAIMRAW